MKIEINGDEISGTFTAIEFPLFRKMVESLTDRKYCVLNDGGTSAKIRAIKEVRAHSGLGLKEAKDVVEGTSSVRLTAAQACQLATILPGHGYRLEEVI